MKHLCFALLVSLWLSGCPFAAKAQQHDFMREIQLDAINNDIASWGHWGVSRDRYTQWKSHSNRMVPVFSFGLNLESVKGKNSIYRDEQRVRELYGRLPENTHQPGANYFDQTDIYRLQQQAYAAGKKYIILIVFDGLDWQTLRAAAIYRSGKVYEAGRGSGLAFQDYDAVETDYGHAVTSPHNDETFFDVDLQIVTGHTDIRFGGYCPQLAGWEPWQSNINLPYLLGEDGNLNHVYADSAASATAMMSGVKTYNGSINIDPHGEQLEPMARTLQKRGLSVGMVTTVPYNHATPASAYANNVTREDYQDITRDLIGLRSVSHRSKPLDGVDVLIGAGWNEINEDDRADQGRNYVPGNKYVTETDLSKIDQANGGNYVVSMRTPGKAGAQVLAEHTELAIQNDKRLFGIFGVAGAHLPYQTADGDYHPAPGVDYYDLYCEQDVVENPTLADMTAAALRILERNQNGFWLLVEAGDVDWAMHNNNIDDAIGAVLSGEAAFSTVTRWAEDHNCWDETAVIVTADHGHLFFLDDSQALCRPSDKYHADN